MNTIYGSKNSRTITWMLKTIIGILLVLAAALPALGSGGEATSGKFHTYAAGIERGYDINGHAHMTRTGSEKTIVKTHATGLAANTSYGVHVHNRACSDANGGGHYMHDPAGGVNPVNEIWPAFTTDEYGVGNGKAVNHFYARPEAQAMVIHDTDGARIACADLD